MPSPSGSNCATPEPVRTPHQVAIDILLLVLACVPLGAAGVESFRAATTLWWAFVPCAVVLAGGLLAGERRIPARALAGLALVLFSAVTLAGTLMVRDAPAIVLLGQGEDFWASAASLAALLAPAAWTAARLSRGLSALPLLLAALSGAGFARVLVTGGSWRPLLEGTGGFAFLPSPHLNPSWVAVTVILPLAAVVALGLAVKAALSGARTRAWTCTTMALFIVAPSAAGLWVILGPQTPGPAGRTAEGKPRAKAGHGRRHIPSVRAVAPLGPSRSQGEARLTYVSTWEQNPRGGFDHQIVVRPRPSRIGRVAGPPMVATVRPPSKEGEPTTLWVSYRPEGPGAEPPDADTLEVVEDEHPQKIASVAPRDTTTGSRVAIFTTWFADRKGEYLERAHWALTRLIARLDRSTRIVLAWHNFGRNDHREVEAREEKDVYEEVHAAFNSTAIRGELPAVLPHIHNHLDRLAFKLDSAVVVALQEQPVGEGEAIDDELARRLFQMRVPIVAIGGGEGGPMERMAQATGGHHVPGRLLEEWSRWLEDVRSIIDHDLVVTYRKVRPPPPPVTIAEPSPGQVVRGPLSVRLEAREGDPYRAEVALDATPLWTFGVGPYRLTTEIAAFDPGPHVLRARSLGPHGESVETTRAIVIEHPPALIQISGGPGREPLRQPATLSIQVKGRAVTRLRAMLDQRPTASWKSPVASPVRHTLDPGALADGPHTLTLVATTRDGQLVRAEMKFLVSKPGISLEVARPRPGARVFGQIPVQVAATPNWPEGKLERVSVRVTGGMLTAHLVGEVSAPPWIVLWTARELSPGPYTITVAATASGGVSRTVTLPVELIKPSFAIEIRRPASGETIAEPVPVELAITDESGLGLDHVAFSAGDVVIDKRIQPPWTARFDPSRVPEGLVRITARARRKDEAAAEATATVLVRRLRAVKVPLAAVGPSGLVPPGLLLARTVTVKVEGRSVRSSRVVAARGVAIRMEISIPVSTWTAQEGNLEPMARALDAFLGRMKGYALMGVVAYGTRARSLANPVDGVAFAREQLGRLPREPGRALYDGMMKGLDELGTSSPRPVLLLIVDGPDEGVRQGGTQSTVSGQQVIARARQVQAEVHVVVIGRGPARAPHLPRGLSRLAAITGGSFQEIPGSADLPRALEQVRAHLASQVMLEVTPTLDQARPGLHAFSVAIPGEEGLTLRHRAHVALR